MVLRIDNGKIEINKKIISSIPGKPIKLIKKLDLSHALEHNLNGLKIYTRSAAV